MAINLKIGGYLAHNPLGSCGGGLDRPFFAQPPEYWTPCARRADVPPQLTLHPPSPTGPGGDVARIIDKSTAGRTGRVHMTDVVGSHPKLVALLTKRFAQAMPLAAVPMIP